MGSIEAAYIALARYIVENPTELTWFPLWYTGIPFENAYPPLLHLTTAGAAWLADFSPARAHHFDRRNGVLPGPGDAVRAGASIERIARRSALATGIFYSLVSPSAILMPATVG